MSPWILTASGAMFDLQYAQPGLVVLPDIAHALAQINRFTGHAVRPYSVAEHSLPVLDIVTRLMPEVDLHGQLAALMHDAHEAYIGDVASPTKRLLPDDWPKLEHRMERTVRSAFALHTAAYEWAGAIKQADLIALATERAQLLPASGGTWEVLTHIQPAEWVDLMEPGRTTMSWADWRDSFTIAVNTLDFARNSARFAVAQP